MRDAAKTKELIEKTALRLFVEKGVAETTIRDIASTAGIAEGTMYRHYPSKDALAWSLFKENLTWLVRDLDLLQQDHRKLKGKLEAMIRRFCAFFDEDRYLFSYLLLYLHGQHRRVTKDMPHPEFLLRGVIAEGMARGEIPKGDADVAAAMVVGIVRQLAVSILFGRMSRSLSSLADTLVAAAWRVLKR
ncbi:MAG: TetR/AcrR family transcriptional regulator [Nitrospinota bacterium]